MAGSCSLFERIPTEDTEVETHDPQARPAVCGNSTRKLTRHQFRDLDSLKGPPLPLPARDAAPPRVSAGRQATADAKRTSRTSDG